MTRSSALKPEPPSFVDSLGEVRRGGPRPLFRAGALQALVLMQRVSAWREEPLNVPRVHFIFSHHVFPDESDSFRSLIRWLASSHTFISYSDAVARMTTGPISEPYLSLSFDDGFAHLLPTARWLASEGISACFFVVPSIVGVKDASLVADFCRKKLHLPPVAFCDWEDLEELVSLGHEVGSHSLSHADLGQLGGAALDAEIRGSFEVLEDRLGGVRHFAWPYGQPKHFNEEASRVVAATGYTSCASAIRGAYCQPSEDAVLKIRREYFVAGQPASNLEYFLRRSASASRAR